MPTVSRALPNSTRGGPVARTARSSGPGTSPAGQPDRGRGFAHRRMLGLWPLERRRVCDLDPNHTTALKTPAGPAPPAVRVAGARTYFARSPPALFADRAYEPPTGPSRADSA